MTVEPPAPGHIRTTITYLEMAERPAPRHRPPPLDRMALLRAEECTVSFYRYLYNTVGEPWLWERRRRMPDEELRAIIQDPLVEIYVAYVGGVPAGFAELDRRITSICDIAYFGLVPDFIGRGIGPWLLEWAVEAGWSGHDVRKMTVNTCTFDHPKALMMYQRVGFTPVRQSLNDMEDPRLTGLIPADAAPHVPLATK